MSQLGDAAAAIAKSIDDDGPVVWGSFNELAAHASQADLDDAVAVLLSASALSKAPPMRAAMRLVASGSLVESGASPSIGAAAIFDVVGRVAAAIVPLVDDDDTIELDQPAEDASEAVRAWHLVVIGAMARLARKPELRRALRGHACADFVRVLHEKTGSRHAYYLGAILDMLDDERLFVVELDGARPVVRKMRAFGVRNGFHLITLLEGNDPAQLSRDGETSVAAKHGWFTWPGIDLVDGRPRARHLGNSLWGEMKARDLLPFEGVRVAVRDEPVLGSRSWSLDFATPLHDALHDRVVEESVLEGADADALVSRMIAAVAR